MKHSDSRYVLKNIHPRHSSIETMKPQASLHSSAEAKEHCDRQDSKVEKLSEDRILEHDGPFQWMVLACTALSVVVCTCHALSIQVSALVMNHWCLPPDDLGDLTQAEWMNASIPVEKDGSFSRCTRYDFQSAFKNDSTKKIVSCGAWYFDLAEHGNTIISEWSIVCNRSWMLPLASLVVDSAAVVCLPFLGMAADRVGRRPVACACVAVLIITGFASALTKSFLFFVAARFAVMASASSLGTILFVVLYEVTVPGRWVLYSTIGAGMAFVVTPLILVPLSLLRLHWAVIHVVLMVPTSFLVATFYVVQESPRWLLATWKLKAAEQVTLMVARTNRFSLDLARQSFNVAATRMRGTISDNDAPLTIALKGLLRQPQHRKNAVLLFYAWFAIDFAYTTITARDYLVTYDWIPLVFVASIVPVFVGLYLCLVYYGRKKVTVAATVLTSIGTAVLGFTYSDSKPTPIAGVVLLFVNFISSAAYAAIFTFTLDLFPTIFRCIGVSTSFACGCAGTLLSALLNEFEATRLRKDQLLLLIAILLMVGAFSLKLLPDMAGEVLFSRTKRTSTEVDRKRELVASLATRSTANKKQSTRTTKAHPRGPQALVPEVGSTSLTARSISADGLGSYGTPCSSKQHQSHEDSAKTTAGFEDNL